MRCIVIPRATHGDPESSPSEANANMLAGFPRVNSRGGLQEAWNEHFAGGSELGKGLPFTMVPLLIGSSGPELDSWDLPFASQLG